MTPETASGQADQFMAWWKKTWKPNNHLRPLSTAFDLWTDTKDLDTEERGMILSAVIEAMEEEPGETA